MIVGGGTAGDVNHTLKTKLSAALVDPVEAAS
jgi:hypothetical protein